MIDLEPLIKQANELAPLPASTVRLSQLISQTDCDLQDVAELISYDQALTVKLLRAANSVASGGIMPVATVQDAVTRLGMAQVLGLAIGCVAKPLLQTRLVCYNLKEGELWRHSVAAAVAAEVIPNFCQVELPPESFTAGLLHDLGKLIMGRFLNLEVLYFIRKAEEVEHLNRLEAESLLLGVNHAELGGLVAQHWQLPARVVQGITYHHHPAEGLDVVCDLTYLANQVAKRIEAGLEGRSLQLEVVPDAMERLGLCPKSLESLCPIASSRFAQVSRRYNAI